MRSLCSIPIKIDVFRLISISTFHIRFPLTASYVESFPMMCTLQCFTSIEFKSKALLVISRKGVLHKYKKKIDSIQFRMCAG